MTLASGYVKGTDYELVIYREEKDDSIRWTIYRLKGVGSEADGTATTVEEAKQQITSAYKEIEADRWANNQIIWLKGY